MKCPRCKQRMIQFPHNKLMINCPICETIMRNPKHLEQTSIQNGEIIKWVKEDKNEIQEETDCN